MLEKTILRSLRRENLDKGSCTSCKEYYASKADTPLQLPENATGRVSAFECLGVCVRTPPETRNTQPQKSTQSAPIPSLLELTIERPRNFPPPKKLQSPRNRPNHPNLQLPLWKHHQQLPLMWFPNNRPPLWIILPLQALLYNRRHQPLNPWCNHGPNTPLWHSTHFSHPTPQPPNNPT